VAVLVLASGSAHAEKKRQTAQILAGVGTGVSSALILGGFAFASQGNPINKPLMYSGLASAMITPSLGQFYAGEYVTIGMAVRVAAAGLATYALTHETKTIQCDDASTSGTMCQSFYGAGIAMLGIAGIAFIGGMAYDVGDAAPAADRYNANHGFVVVPTAVSTPTGPAPGVSISGVW
jgi:hypothetical protein